jgi:hypothetical protein
VGDGDGVHLLEGVSSVCVSLMVILGRGVVTYIGCCQAASVLLMDGESGLGKNSLIWADGVDEKQRRVRP